MTYFYKLDCTDLLQGYSVLLDFANSLHAVRSKLIRLLSRLIPSLPSERKVWAG